MQRHWGMLTGYANQSTPKHPSHSRIVLLLCDRIRSTNLSRVTRRTSNSNRSITHASSSCLLRESVANFKDLLLGGSLALASGSLGGGSLANSLVSPRDSLLDLEGSTGVTLRAGKTSLLDGRLGVLGVLSFLGSLLGCAVGSGGNSGLADGVVDLLVHGFKGLAGFKLGLDVARKLCVVFFTALAVTLELLHVGSNVDAEDVLSVNLGVVLAVHVAGETVVRVRDIQAAISSSLEDTEDACASCGAAQTNIQNNLERVPLAFSGLEVATVGVVPASKSGKCVTSPRLYLLLAVSLGNTLVLIGQLEGGESTAGKEKTGGISRGIVGDTNILGQAVFGKLVSIRGAKHLVALEVRRNNLRGDVAVAEADDHAVLRSVVLVAVLDNEATTGIIVRLAFTSPTELHLKPLEVRPGLQHFNERHLSRVLI
jgi:hypothetical protein